MQIKANETKTCSENLNINAAQYVTRNMFSKTFKSYCSTSNTFEIKIEQGDLQLAKICYY